MSVIVPLCRTKQFHYCQREFQSIKTIEKLILPAYILHAFILYRELDWQVKSLIRGTTWCLEMLVLMSGSVMVMLSITTTRRVTSQSFHLWKLCMLGRVWGFWSPLVVNCTSSLMENIAVRQPLDYQWISHCGGWLTYKAGVPRSCLKESAVSLVTTCMAAR